MRFVIIQGVVLNTEAIDMIVPQGQQSEVSLRGGATRLFDLSAEELLEHLRQEGDNVLRVVHDPAADSQNPDVERSTEESA